MGLNDQLEKYRQADEWLATTPVGSEHYLAALDFLGATDMAKQKQIVSKDVLEAAIPNVRGMTIDNLTRNLAYEVLRRGGVPVTKIRVEEELLERFAYDRDFIEFTVFVPTRTVK